MTPRFDAFVRRLTDYEQERRVRYDRFDLANVRGLLDRLGAPDRAFPVFQIAGSDGKGSTATFAAALLRGGGPPGGGGLRVGLFTSPHLAHVRERIQVDGAPISAAALERCFARAEPRLPDSSGALPTFFELMTALALFHFRNVEVDAAVLEVGLGGRLDATSATSPVAMAITSVTLEHTRILGSSLERIAREKAGVLRPGAPCVVGRLRSEAGGAVRAVAAEVGATLLESPSAVRAEAVVEVPGGVEATLVVPGRGPLAVRVGAAGRHMAWNAALALALVDAGLAVAGRERPAAAAVQRALARARVPGRFERLAAYPDVVVVLDVAHTEQATRALARTWRAQCPGRAAMLVFGALKDKVIEPCLAALREVTVQVFATVCPSRRSLSAAQVAAAASRVGLPATVCASEEEALQRAVEAAREGGHGVLVTGSAYLVGAVARRMAGWGEGDRNLPRGAG